MAFVHLNFSPILLPSMTDVSKGINIEKITVEAMNSRPCLWTKKRVYDFGVRLTICRDVNRQTNTAMATLNIAISAFKGSAVSFWPIYGFFLADELLMLPTGHSSSKTGN